MPKLDRTARDAHERLADGLGISAIHSDADARAVLSLEQSSSRPLDQRITESVHTARLLGFAAALTASGRTGRAPRGREWPGER